MSGAAETGATRAARLVAQLAVWTLAWVASLAIAKFGSIQWWGDQPVVAWIAIVVNVLLGAGWIVAHARYLHGIDELQRKIMLDALALGVGVGVVGGCAASVANTAGLIAFEADVALVTVIIALVYLVGIAVGNYRYR